MATRSRLSVNASDSDVRHLVELEALHQELLVEKPFPMRTPGLDDTPFAVSGEQPRNNAAVARTERRAIADRSRYVISRA